MNLKLEDFAKLCQGCLTSKAVVVLGSGSSIPHNIPGMDELTTHLIKSIQDLSPRSQSQWEKVCLRLEDGNHLEQALIDEAVSEELLDKIVENTWIFISKSDYQLFEAAIDIQYNFPISKLLTGILNSTAVKVDVITTNYDRVVEYAADKSELFFKSGFYPGYLRHEDNENTVNLEQKGVPLKSVNIWKVHGSLDWFVDENGRVISLPVWEKHPPTVKPLIVTPGYNKYRSASQEPYRTVIAGADKALVNASSFICSGYGFRDEHIHPKLSKRCKQFDVPILILAHTLTPEAKSFMRNSGGKYYIAVENHDEGSMVYTPNFPNGALLRGEKYWMLSQMNSILGL